MPDPLDLTDLFGEGWCVTLSGCPVSEALDRLGVAGSGVLDDGLALATERLTFPVDGDDGVLLLARRAGPGWTLVLELEGSGGWTATDPGLLGALAPQDGIAVSVVRDPDRTDAMVAEAGAVRAGLSLVTGRRWGTVSRRLDAALTATGLLADDEPPDAVAALTPSQRATVLIHALTGVELSRELLDGPWTGGIAASGR